MANYAQFPADSFAARARKTQATGFAAPPRGPAGAPRSPAADADFGDYGSLLVVRVGRPKKRPVLMLDPAEAAAAAAQFQQVAAENFANPEAFERRCAIVRLSALAANETGLEDYDTPAATESPDADAALAIWANPVEPIDTSDWCDAPAQDQPVAEAEAVQEPVATEFEPFFVTADEPELPVAEAVQAGPDYWDHAEPAPLGRIARLKLAFVTLFDRLHAFRFRSN